MGDSEVTKGEIQQSLSKSIENKPGDEPYDMDGYVFDNLLDTPNCEEATKELSGKKTKVLVPIIALHPKSIKGIILNHAKGMINPNPVVSNLILV